MTTFNTTGYGVDDVTTTQQSITTESTTNKTKNSYTYPASIDSTDSPHGSFLVMRSMNMSSTNKNKFFETRNRVSTNQAINYEILSTINIYMPAIVENITQNYEDAQQSLVGQFMNEVATGNISAGGLASKATGMAIGSAVRGFLGHFNDAYQQQSGKIVSPNLVGSYKGPERRQQSLTFHFNPKNLAELKEVSSIIKELHLGSLPKRGGVPALLDAPIDSISSNAGASSSGIREGIKQGLMTYDIPPIWILEEVKPNSDLIRYTPRFIFGPAGITSIRMNKTPDQYWKTFKDTAGDSASIVLEINFVELFPMDQTTYANDIASNIKGYTRGI